MNDFSLSSLYRRLAAQPVQLESDAADLVAVVSGDAGLDATRRDAVVATLAASSKHADLARVLRELQADSAALAERVNERRVVAHPSRGRGMQAGAGVQRRHHARRLRWAGALAASLVVALGVWTMRSSDKQQPIATAQGNVRAPDRIFTSSDHIFASSDDVKSAHSHAGGDEVFRGSFIIGG